MNRFEYLALLAVAALAVPTTLSAQSVGIYGGGVTLTGDDFSGDEQLEADWGFLVGADVLFPVSEGFSAGVRGSYTNVGFNSDPEGDVQFVDVALLGRYEFPGETARLFFSGEVGASWQTSDVLAVGDPMLPEGEDATATGFIIGPAVGVLFPLDRVGIEAALEGIFKTYGELDSVEASDTETFQITGRLGVRIPFGS